MSDILRFSCDGWATWHVTVREALVRTGFDDKAIQWICRDMATRWQGLPPSKDGPVFTTTETHAGEVQRACDAVQELNNESLLALAHIVLDLEIDLYYALNPPSGGTRLRLAA
jgi:hypothetical protein